jgi:hypothetical protein
MHVAGVRFGTIKPADRIVRAAPRIEAISTCHNRQHLWDQMMGLPPVTATVAPET